MTFRDELLQEKIGQIIELEKEFARMDGLVAERQRRIIQLDRTCLELTEELEVVRDVLKRALPTAPEGCSTESLAISVGARLNDLRKRLGGE